MGFSRFLKPGEMYVEKKRSKCYETFSLLVSRCLDQIGTAEVVRQFWMKNETIKEALSVLLSGVSDFDKTCTVYHMGSLFEGSTTSGMESDRDLLYCMSTFLVIQDENEARNDVDCLLLVQDIHTKPGYGKLQLVLQGTPVFNKKLYNYALDCNGRVVRLRTSFLGPLADDIHGPAETRFQTDSRLATDYVVAFRCQTWPKVAIGWFNRERKFNWPSENMIEKMKSMGFFVVQAGHPNSAEKDIEWRISLSLQERFLMQSLNTTQFQCYVLLKMIKKDVISHMVKDQSLTSYHLKTCLLYSIEESPAEFWKPQNLLLCPRKCLFKLYVWVTNENCPNYFIPEENIFEGRIEGNLKTRAKQTLEKLLKTDFHYLLYVRCDSFNELLKQFCFGKPRIQSFETGKQKILIMHSVLNELLFKRSYLMEQITTSNADSRHAFRSLVKTSCALRRIRSTNEHSEQDILQAKSMLLPYIEQFIMSSAIEHIVAINPVDTESILLSEAWNGLCSGLDCVSAKLKQATYLYTFGYYEASLRVLDTVISNSVRNEDNIPIFLSVCKCRDGQIHENYIFSETLPRLVETSEVSDAEFSKRFWAPCVIFLPYERNLIPQVLQFELQRSVCMPDETKHFWYNWAIVDSRILLHFLRYLNFQKLEKNLESLVEFKNISVFLWWDLNLGHRETGLNILGWMLNNEDELYLALEMFQISLVLTKQHNAAVWLLGTTLQKLFFPEYRNQRHKSTSVRSDRLSKMTNGLKLALTRFVYKFSPELMLNAQAPENQIL